MRAGAGDARRVRVIMVPGEVEEVVQHRQVGEGGGPVGGRAERGSDGELMLRRSAASGPTRWQALCRANGSRDYGARRRRGMRSPLLLFLRSAADVASDRKPYEPCILDTANSAARFRAIREKHCRLGRQPRRRAKRSNTRVPRPTSLADSFFFRRRVLKCPLRASENY